MHAQRCPNCRERNDVSVYVHGQLARCVRCGLRFSVERNAAAAPPSPEPAPSAAPSPAVTEHATDVSFSRGPDEQAETQIAGFNEQPSNNEERQPEAKPPTVDQRPAMAREQAPVELQGQAVPDIPGYVCLELLGRGGMGEVWKARQVSLDRLVAIKILSPTLAVEPDFVRRFERESTALAALSHPHIVSVYDRGSANGHWFFVMEFVQGKSLRDRAVDGKLSQPDLLRLVSQTARAVDYAHTRGVIHRDLKPENILVDHVGAAKVADFGLAGMSEHGRSSLTMTAVAMGTAHYMAPEQRRDAKNVDGRADLYSIGVMLYELLTNELPVGRFDTPVEKLPELDPRLDAMILKLLEQDPTKRPSRAIDVALLLESVAAGPAVPENPSPPDLESALAALPPSPLFEPPPRSVESFIRTVASSPRRRLLVAAAAAVLALVVAVVLMNSGGSVSSASSAVLAADVLRDGDKGATVVFGAGNPNAVLAKGTGWSVDGDALVRNAATVTDDGGRATRAYLETVRLDFKDAAAEVDVVVQEPSEGLANEPPFAELVLYADKDNHVGVRLNFEEDAGTRFFSMPAVKAPKGSEPAVRPETGKTHHLEVFLKNRQATVKVDGKLVASAVMSGLENVPVRAALGCVGRCRFTNVKLRGPLTDAPPTAAASKL